MKLNIDLDATHKVYPNSKFGALSMLRDNMTPRWQTKLNLKACSVTPAQSNAEGIWYVDNANTHTRITVYLAGYQESDKSIRKQNVFEEQQIPNA